MLSHTAVTAREYRLLAVLCVTDATRLIKDGQLIEVDGAKGYRPHSEIVGGLERRRQSDRYVALLPGPISVSNTMLIWVQSPAATR